MRLRRCLKNTAISNGNGQKNTELEMKKTISLIIFVCTLIISSLVLSACEEGKVTVNGDPNAHTHEFVNELAADEYTLDIEIEKKLFKEEAFVTVSYEGCSCSFMVFKE